QLSFTALLGQPVQPQQFVLENVGGSPLAIEAVRATGEGIFASNDCRELAPLASCTVTGVVQPVRGGQATAGVLVVRRGQGPTPDLAVSGFAFEPPQPVTPVVDPLAEQAARLRIARAWAGGDQLLRGGVPTQPVEVLELAQGGVLRRGGAMPDRPARSSLVN